MRDQIRVLNVMRQREKIMILQSKRVWVLNQWMEAQIEVCRESGKIEAIRPYGSAPADMDFVELRVVPGFIDVHTHGAYGFDTNDAEEEGRAHTRGVRLRHE